MKTKNTTTHTNMGEWLVDVVRTADRLKVDPARFLESVLAIGTGTVKLSVFVGGVQ